MSAEIAKSILAAADKYGFKVQVRGSILTITKSFTAGNEDAFVECDMTYHDVLSLLPRTSSGSDWGTEGGGIGGAVAVKSGFFQMNRSGGSKRVLAALSKLL